MSGWRVAILAIALALQTAHAGVAHAQTAAFPEIDALYLSGDFAATAPRCG